ncbi:MAG: restriction endonuclease [Gemmatimonadota bacterium]|nr:restriction endonuclease [Gemmatimonadota bacterium]
MTQIADSQLQNRIVRLRNDVESWAQRRDLWLDCDFFDYTDRIKPVEWDDTAYVLVLAADGPLADVVMGSGGGYAYQPEEFENILRQHGFWYENHDYGSLWIYPFDEELRQDYRPYMRWKWICSLIQPGFDLLYSELYEHLSSRPGDMAKLDWRAFEKIVASLLESQGYDVQLGSGRSDGGVDIQLLQRDPIGDIVTYVQVKRFRKDRPVRLGTVQALYGAAMADNVTKTMLVTTSRYLPSAKRFAERDNVRMELYVSTDVRKWCADAYDGIVEDKRLVVSDELVASVLDAARGDLQRVLHSSGGYGMITNSFAVVLKETPYSALLLELTGRVTSDDGFGQRGEEVPDLTSSPRLVTLAPERIRRARKLGSAYTDGSNYYSRWSGRPVPFDYCD